MRSRKAQGGEMIGLLVIIILLLVLVALYFRFASKPESTITEESIISIASNNYLAALSQQTLCSNRDFKEAISDCIKGSPLCGHQDSCGYLEEVANTSLYYSFPQDYQRQEVVFMLEDTSFDPPKEMFRVPDIKLSCAGVIAEDDVFALAKARTRILRCS